MNGDLNLARRTGYRAGDPVSASVARAGDPVPGNFVPILIHRGHDGVLPGPGPAVPDREAEPPLIGKRDAPCRHPATLLPAAGVQDGRSRLIEEFSQAEDRAGRNAVLSDGLRLRCA